MPRLPPSLFQRARCEDPLLAKLLPACRTLTSARNELRWLRQHAQDVANAPSKSSSGNEAGCRVGLKSLVAQRARGKPLQYILGTEFFGDLELACRPGVLIPRPDTANAIIYLAYRIANDRSLGAHQGLRVLDLCTGSGCIPLLFHHEITQLVEPETDLELLGIDVSETALALARLNKSRQLKRRNENTDLDASHRDHTPILRSLANIDFIQGDVLDNLGLVAKLKSRHTPSWDVLVSNPPYISKWAFEHLTEPSVQKFEPLLALVPPASNSGDELSQSDDLGDLFYGHLVKIAQNVSAKVVWFEVADIEQARRVATAITSLTSASSTSIELWREQLPQSLDRADAQSTDDIYGDFKIIGKGNGRSVVWWRL